MAFAQLEPFGFESEIYGHAITSSTIANVNRPKGKHPYTTDDFMPKEKQHRDPSELFDELRSFVKSTTEKPRKKKDVT